MYKKTVQFSRTLTSLKAISDDHLIVIDKYLVDKQPFAKWLQNFSHVYAVDAGEQLKDSAQLIKHLQNIFKLKDDLTRSSTLVAVGGGSVGDFAGFVASITKRGLHYQVIPTTWLAVLDSAHGGKNGLNFKGIKNQIGTVYQPEKVHIVDEVLQALPVERLCEARGEIVKTAFLCDEATYKKMSSADVYDLEAVQKKLKVLVATKYKIVEQDPFETKGIRYQLNLGHTLGHVFESHLKIPHGLAIFLGLYFCFTWSHRLGKCNDKIYSLFKNYFFRDLEKLNLIREFLKAYTMSNAQLLRILMQDKKRSSSELLHFVFPVKAGQTEIQKVKINDVLAEYKQQAKNIKEHLTAHVSVQG